MLRRPSMITNNTFNHLFLLGRPASGKSEFIDYMKKIDAVARKKEFFIGNLEIVDDFLWLWEKFEEDDLWQKVVGKRFHSKISAKSGAYLLGDGTLFEFLIEKFNYVIAKKYLPKPEFYKDNTLIIEFARGGERPYRPALNRFKPEILKKGAILYVEVTGAESRRRNEARYQEKLKHSVLAHKTPDEDMDRFYREDDWSEIVSKRRDGYVEINGVKVPFVNMNNEPESTDVAVLADRYGKALKRLNELASA